MSQLALQNDALPSLLTDCVIVGHANKADVVFTPPQWFGMCVHMLNDNPRNQFLMPMRGQNGEAKYAKSKNVDAMNRAKWAWDTICGTHKSPASIGFYPKNDKNESRWGAMDFDAHDGNAERARTLAHKAFALMIRQPNLYLALCTSAGDEAVAGWHLFVFSTVFYPCDEWTRLLKQVAAQIGTEVQSGVCEVFPNPTRGKTGYGIRAPGTWNPKSNDCGKILFENWKELYPATDHSAYIKSIALYPLGKLPSNGKLSLPSSEIWRGKWDAWKTKFAITGTSQRHEQLKNFVGEAFFQCGKETAKRNAAALYAEASPTPRASLAEHEADFERLWAGMVELWLERLNEKERIAYDNLIEDNRRDAFKIIQNWSKAKPNEPDFKVHCESLAAMLGLTVPGVSAIRKKFCEIGILAQTAAYIPRKHSARFKWLLKSAAAPAAPIEWNLLEKDNKRVYQLDDQLRGTDEQPATVVTTSVVVDGQEVA